MQRVKPRRVKLSGHATYYVIFIEGDRISVCGAPLISKERTEKLNFRIFNKKLDKRLSFATEVTFIMYLD